MPMQNTDLITTYTPAITYMGPGVEWTIGKQAHVGSNNSNGIRSTYAASELVNKGTVYSNLGAGVLFIGDNSDISNKATGTIIGGIAGVYLDGANDNLWNHGEIYSTSSNGTGVFVYSGDETLVGNFGDIFGDGAGIYVQGGPTDSAGPKIDNHDRIHSNIAGIVVEAYADEKTTIINRDGAKIIGGSLAVSVNDGAITLKNMGVIKGLIQTDDSADGDDKVVNKGKIKGGVSLWGGHDKVVNKGMIKGEVDLGRGDDIYKNKGGKAGMVSSDYGNDTLIAGDSRDKFLFSGGLNAFENVDRVKKFEPGYDKFYLHPMIFDILGPGSLPASQFHEGKAAADFDDYIIYDKKEGALYYDRDGSGNLFSQIEFARVDKKLDLSHHDFVVMA